MKREEEITNAALEEYAEQNLDCKWAFMHGAKWSDEHPRKGLVDIDKACEWLKKNIHNYLHITGGGYWFDKGVILDLRKAMEE